MERQAYNKSYKRKVDTAQIPVCSILGVDIAAINMDWLLHFLDQHLEDLSGDYITVANVHTTVTAYENPHYRRVQNGGVMAVPDGGPLSTLARKRGYRETCRTTGPGLMDEILRISEKKNYRHFFYGSTPETLKKMRRRLGREYPDLKIVGMVSPPFRSLTEDEDRKVVKRINESGADFIWVGLGAPKQEEWMAAHQGKLRGLMIGVGAGFDYLAGNIRRAPDWMQRSNLEWVYRLLQDPARLLKRYWHTNTKFIWNAIIKGK